MMKTWVAAGIALVVLSVTVVFLMILPRTDPVPNTPAGTTAEQRVTPSTPAPGDEGFSNTALALAAAGAGLALASGFVLIGIGLGHWKRPTPPSPERPRA
jgi:hypothetical protein